MDARAPALSILTVGTLYPPHSIGGYEMNWRDIVAHLRGRGHSVRVLCGTWRVGDNGQPEDDDVHRLLELWVDDLFDVRKDPSATVLARERRNDDIFRKALADVAPDVVLIGPTGGLPLGLLRRGHLQGIPQLAFVFDDWPGYAPGADPWQRRLRRYGPLADRFAARHELPGRFRPADIDDWIIITERTRAVALRAGVDRARTSLLAPGPDQERFPPSAPPPWRGELLYSGRLHPAKGVEHALAAMARLPDCRLTIKGGGDPRYRNKLEGIARELGLGDRVTFLDGGGFEALPQLYGEVDAILFPSVWEEPWGLVPLEAMSVGRPVVACAVGGAAEYLRDEHNALVVAPRDPAAIAAAVERLAADSALRERLRTGGSETAARFRYSDFLDTMAVRVERTAARVHKPTAPAGVSPA